MAVNLLENAITPITARSSYCYFNHHSKCGFIRIFDHGPDIFFGIEIDMVFGKCEVKKVRLGMTNDKYFRNDLMADIHFWNRSY